MWGRHISILKINNMKYTVQQLADLAKVTTRTLHYYDEVGLLKPAKIESNGYRKYGEKELLRLQQIMFFRELDFPLAEIKKIIESPDFDIAKALTEHRKLIELNQKRTDNLLKTIDKTLKKIKDKKDMNDNELYDGFSKEKMEEYAKEAKERWGDTEAYKQSVGKYEKLTREEKIKMKEDGDRLMEEIVKNMSKGVDSDDIQNLIAKHYDGLRFFYEPNLELYRNLGLMYVGDKRFSAYFEKYHKDLPVFMRDAMHVYCDTHKK